MHTKTDSDVTSLPASTPPRSPPPARRGAVYYVESPSQNDVDKLSYNSTPPGSPPRPHYHHHHYHCSPIHHSRESSSTSRFSSSLFKPHHHPDRDRSGWRRINHGMSRVEYSGDVGECEHEEDEEEDEEGGPTVRFYVGCFVVTVVVLWVLFALVLWGVSKSFRPHVLVKKMVFWEFNIQAGMDITGVPTDMLSLNSTVHMSYINPATFFGVHVTSTPFELYYYDLKLAFGQMKKFYQKRKSHSNVTTVVQGHQIPLYGGMSFVSDTTQFGNSNIHTKRVTVGLNLTFTVRSRAYILGKLVKSKFYTHVRCPVTLDANHLRKSVSLVRSCVYR